MRKKLFAILMSAMMMVTFMPAMAFAAETPQWAADYTSVSYNGVTYPVVRTLEVYKSGSDVNKWTGGIVASVDTTKVDGTVPNAITNVTYYDLSSIDVVGANNQALKAVMSATNFLKAFPQNVASTTMTLKFNVPKNLTGYTPDMAGYVAYDGNGHERTAMDNWSVKVATPAYDTANAYVAQPFTLNWNVTNTATAGTSYSKIAGQLAPMSITVSPETKAVSGMTNSDYVVDTKTALNAVDYDGAEHVVNQKAYPGITTTYKLWKDGAFVAVDKATVKEKGTYTFEATATDGVTKSNPAITLNVTVNAANLPTMEFDTSDAAGNKVFSVAEGFDATKYLVLAPYTGSRWHPVSATKQAADKKAIAANEELLKAYFNDFFEIKQTVDKYDATKIVAEIVKKDMTKLTTAEKDAFVAKYAAMFANFGKTLTRGNVANAAEFFLGKAGDKATFNVTNAGDIEWVKAPLTKKYYNKKGTLKKTYTFAVEAKAGCKVTYKLSNGGEMIKIDKNTGKVTVKKGLKVGTYKVAITAKAGKSTETYELVIKMAKKK